jgi:preprotein translocase subunit YajC
MGISFIIAVMQVPGGGSAFSLALPLVLMLAFAYLVLILPQQKRQKKWQTMLDALKTGDRVITSGGIRGTVIALKDDALHLRVPPDNLRLEVTKASVVSVATPDEGK